MASRVAVQLETHNPDWARWAAREVERLRTVVGESLLKVHHIGSTAISGIVAKPILDLLPVFQSLAELNAARPMFESLGYDWRGEYGLPGRRYCTLRDPQTGRRLVHAHGYAAGDPEIARHLAFRDYLRAHAEIAGAYEAEKKRCRLLHPHDSGAYSEAKNAWIQPVQSAALTWWRARRGSEN